MRVALLTQYREDFSVGEGSTPTTTSPNDVVVRVGAARCCRTDIHVWDGRSTLLQKAAGIDRLPGLRRAVADAANFADAQRPPTAYVEDVVIVG